MTLSITGRCPRTGQLGVAVSSHSIIWTFLPSYRSVSQLSYLSLAAGGIGVAIGQANAPPSLPAAVLRLLDAGSDAQKALDEALAEETKDVREHCQVAVVDAEGRAAAFTGERPEQWRGHRVGDGYVAAGNILAGEQVVREMAELFESKADLPLDERLLTALDDGVAAGGDSRGQRSGLLRVATDNYVTDLEIRVHEHANPLSELRRLLAVYHEEGDFMSIALNVANAVRAALPELEIERRADMTTHDAIGQLRELVAESEAGREHVETIDRLLAALPEQPYVSELRFGDAISLLDATAGGPQKNVLEAAGLTRRLGIGSEGGGEE